VGDLAEILRPAWDAEKWINEGWSKLSTTEKAEIKARVDKLFANGMPLELRHDKIFYIYTFSMLAQLEVLAIQVPLKFQDKLTSPFHRDLMHAQLLDEIFHGMVFTKVVYMLSEPHAMPPAYNQSIEKLCNFIRDEDCPKIAVVLLNLIGEGWIEQIFYSLQRQNIAPEIFDVILSDEHRHVSEAELYRDIGLPDMEDVQPKLAFLEEHLFGNVFMQYKYISSVCKLIGMDESKKFLHSLHEKHVAQLKNLKLEPSAKWGVFMQTTHKIYESILEYNSSLYAIPTTPMRLAYMTQWSDPSDPTMLAEFDLNISCLQFFQKKYPPETLTTLMLQSISHCVMKEDIFRNFLNHKKLFQSSEAYVGIVVKLPECGDHVGAVVFKNCHLLNINILAMRIKNALQIMGYCYKRRQQLEAQNPRLKKLFDKAMYDFNYGFYPYPLPACPITFVSNIGFTGYKYAHSPLRNNEGLKFTLTAVERKLIWNKQTDEFEPQDILPVSIAGDHRVFDGYIPVPKLLAHSFDECFKLIEITSGNTHKHVSAQGLFDTIEKLIVVNEEFAYRALMTLQTTWFDFMNLDEIFDGSLKNKVKLAYNYVTS
jgi:hypothetical protein